MPTILIAGASRGLGLEFVRQYAEAGCEVIAGCRSPGEAAALMALTREHPVRVVRLDVTDPASIAALRREIGARPLDIVVACAGVYGPRAQSFGDLDEAAWLEVLNVNSLGPLRVAEAFAESVKAARGKLVAITSLMGSIADSSGGALIYRASKAALNAAFKGVALALKDDGVAVAVLHPGWVSTDMGGAGAPVTPERSVAGMRRVIQALTLGQTGGFKDFEGRDLPW